MPPVLTEAARPSKKRSRIAETKAPVRDGVRALHVLEKHVLMDGFKIVIDLEKSRGSYMYDEATGRRLIDLYGFFGSLTIGFNHPYFDEPSVKEDLLRAAKFKVANSDIYSEGYAEFVDAFSRVAGFPPLERYLFIEGGALAIENTLKAAMDWKVGKNLGRERHPADLRRSANWALHYWAHLVLPAFQGATRSAGVWKKSAGLRRDGRTAAR